MPNKSFLRIFAALRMEPKARILNHAVVLFLRNGIKIVSTDNIAADLAMSKKTLYKTFANKDEIVSAVITRHLSKAQSECTSVAGHATNAVAQMLDIAQWADQQFTGIHPSIFYDLKKYHPAAWALFAAHKNTFVLDQIVQNLRWGMAEGLFRPDLDVEVLARLNLARIELTFDPALYPPTQFTLKRINRVLDEHFLLGVATLKGHKLINEYRRIQEAE